MKKRLKFLKIKSNQLTLPTYPNVNVVLEKGGTKFYDDISKVIYMSITVGVKITIDNLDKISEEHKNDWFDYYVKNGTILSYVTTISDTNDSTIDNIIESSLIKENTNYVLNNISQNSNYSISNESVYYLYNSIKTSLDFNISFQSTVSSNSDITNDIDITIDDIVCNFKNITIYNVT